MYGIPNMKLPKEVVARRVGLMKAEGVEFRLNTEADASLRADFDAVLLCGGARRARRLNVPGEEAEGVALAVDYLSEATRALLEGRASALDRAGQGCARGRRRRYRQRLRRHLPPAGLQSPSPSWKCCPPRPRGATQNNPWPEWPRVLRTDYGQREAIAAQGRRPAPVRDHRRARPCR